MEGADPESARHFPSERHIPLDVSVGLVKPNPTQVGCECSSPQPPLIPVLLPPS